MAMSVHSRDFHSTEALPLAEMATLRLQTYFKRLINVSWTLVANGDEIVARCEVHARSGRFFSAGRSPDMAVAIHEASDRIIRQRRRQKRMTERARPRVAVL